MLGTCYFLCHSLAECQLLVGTKVHGLADAPRMGIPKMRVWYKAKAGCWKYHTVMSYFGNTSHHVSICL